VLQENGSEGSEIAEMGCPKDLLADHSSLCVRLPFERAALQR
jgi:hypothetical protein